ncbi:histone-lysine N-methyltransferase SETMAR [Caerostris extrusa]|uniref:Histone-lysine N-methyltransferase SETMAR n=1 Tax=Caerostris extrusa TaxID=172846 RepID=A0AAV4X5C7_CAEEX|nr:histone-lysine N-methyltransferase SETMAR [Caerostris extrusa]
MHCLNKSVMGHEKDDRVISQQDNAPCHRTFIIQGTIKTLIWDLLPHQPYSSDLGPSDYHLFRTMAHDLLATLGPS